MKTNGSPIRRWLAVALVPLAGVPGLRGANPMPADAVKIVGKQGVVQVLPPGMAPANWISVETNNVLRPRWRLRTLKDSRVTLQLADGTVLIHGQQSEIEIMPARPGGPAGLRFLKGGLSFLHKDEPRRIEMLSRATYTGVKGTEFVMTVEEINALERVRLYVIDGRITVTNQSNLLTPLTLTNGQQALIDEGQPPVTTAGFVANNVLQWAFYYPAVLDLRDLPLDAAEAQALAGSLDAYRQGDLPGALTNYPAGRAPASDAERLYRAALLLSVGNVAESEAALDALPAADPSATLPRLTRALRTLIAAVKRQPAPAGPAPALPTEFLAASYHAQSRAVRETSLREALALAQRAAADSPEFSFASARVAELEFSFGRAGAAREALDRSLKIAPRNAQALALRGFVAAAGNRTREAEDWFERAIRADPALANAWLGRGLVSIRRGDDRAGRADLLVAAALEPQRSALRSYLGKALANSGDLPRAIHELELAKQLDPADPTPWLYSALLNEQANRLNQGIRDLGRSIELNDNRRVYRSSERLDSDMGARRANMARLYDEAGLGDVAIREAGEAVAANYSSYSAHLFLANAYQRRRSATPFGQRYETPAVSEYLLASLLGPADARLLAQPVSQQEYTQLFERDGLGFTSLTEYLSRGAWHQYGAQHGTLDNTSYALEAEYNFDPGQTRHADFESVTYSAKVKHMITPQDGILFQIFQSSLEGGDVGQHYDPRTTSSGVRFENRQWPNLLAGYHREWAPGSHTLVLASRFDDHLDADLRNGPVWLLATDGGAPDFAAPTDLTRSYSRRFVVNSLELQQAQEIGPHQLVAGVRLQYNTQDIDNRDAALPGNLTRGRYDLYIPVPHPFPRQDVRLEGRRASLYLHDYWQVTEHWQLAAGVTADFLRLPLNDSSPPVSEESDDSARVLPQVGILWQPRREAAARLSYSQSRSGHSFDQSLRLEPAQFASLPTAFRSVFPDSLLGGISGERIEVWQADGRLQLGANTYSVLGFQQLEARASRQVGALRSEPGGPPVLAQAGERLSFREQRLQFSLRHLLGNHASAGVRYEVARARLHQKLTGISPAYCDDGGCTARREGWFHSLSLDLAGYHPSGFFAGAAAVLRIQTGLGDSEYAGSLPDERFWQIDLYAGYRSPRRRFECVLGLLNVTDQDYRLHPINSHAEPARERTLAVVTRFNF